jgi:hypothetical protein
LKSSHPHPSFSLQQLSPRLNASSQTWSVFARVRCSNQIREIGLMALQLQSSTIPTSTAVSRARIDAADTGHIGMVDVDFELSFNQEPTIIHSPIHLLVSFAEITSAVIHLVPLHSFHLPIPSSLQSSSSSESSLSPLSSSLHSSAQSIVLPFGDSATIAATQTPHLISIISQAVAALRQELTSSIDGLHKYLSPSSSRFVGQSWSEESRSALLILQYQTLVAQLKDLQATTDAKFSQLLLCSL